MLGGEPGHRLVPAAEVLGRDAGLGLREGDGLPVPVQQQVPAVGGLEVVVEQPEGRRSPVGVAVLGVGQLAGVGAQQVMDGVAARGVLADQVRTGQLGQ